MDRKQLKSEPMETMTKKQFLLSLVGFGFILIISLLVVFSISSKTPSDESDSKATSYDTLYETHKVDNVAQCQEKAKNFRIKIKFNATIGRDLIAVKKRKEGDDLMFNSLWLNGNKSTDIKTLYQARSYACENKIPVIVIRARPDQGLDVSERLKFWNYYKPTSAIKSWALYDLKLEYYIKILQDIPSIVVMEPDLFMLMNDISDDSVTVKNQRYQEMFLERVMKLIEGLPKSWLYLDVGNPIFLREHMNEMNDLAATLTRLQGIRGFVINTQHFMSDEISEFWARKLYCRTGLHYIIDSSRNGGSFSKRNQNQIMSCPFDPPHIKPGASPGWAWGSRNKVVAEGSIYYSTTTTHLQVRSQFLLSKTEATGRVRKKAASMKECVEKPSRNDAQDANVWVKNPGESDGRLYNYGEFQPCLIDHSVTCTGSCQMIAPKEKKSKPKECDCKKKKSSETDDYSNYYDNYDN